MQIKNSQQVIEEGVAAGLKMFEPQTIQQIVSTITASVSLSEAGIADIFRTAMLKTQTALIEALTKYALGNTDLYTIKGLTFEMLKTPPHKHYAPVPK